MFNSITTPLDAYEFQRENLIFSLIPLSELSLHMRSHTIPRTVHFQNVEQFMFPITNEMPYFDSSYSNEQLSSTNQLNNKRCKSTYNIVLSPTNQDNNLQTYRQYQEQLHFPCPRPWSTYYQQHISSVDSKTEIRKDCTTVDINNKAFKTHCFTKLSNKYITQTNNTTKVSPKTIMISSKDAASQTIDIETRYSPITRRKLREKVSWVLTDSCEKKELNNNNSDWLLNTPVNIKSHAPSVKQAISNSTSGQIANARDNGEKRKRTVHIDVYCTCTDDDLIDENDNINNLSSNNIGKTKKMQKIIFEDSNMCIIHTDVKDDILPRGFEHENAFLKRVTAKCDISMKIPSITSLRCYESDELFSSLYPSQYSSYNRFRDVESSIASSTNITYNSASSTSWKDTISDSDSLVNKTNFTPCESVDFVNLVDQERIKQLETMIKKSVDRSIATKTDIWWPSTKHKYLSEKKLMKDFIEKHLPIKSSSESSDSSISKSENNRVDENGWSFASSEKNLSIVTEKRKLMQLNITNIVDRNTKQFPSTFRMNREINQENLMKKVKSNLFHDRIGPFGLMSPLLTPMKLQSKMSSPFTTSQGNKTDHIIKASIFGRLVNTVKKPGHHEGPAKNPVCSCEHCKRHYE